MIVLVISLIFTGCGTSAASMTDGSSTSGSTTDDTGEDHETEDDGDVPEITEGTDTTEVTVTALNVGKADAFVIQSANGTVLIDTATEEEADTILSFLAENGITEIDAMIISHFDKDHVGGADQILQAVTVKSVYTSYLAKESDDVVEFFTALEEQGMTNTVVSETTEIQVDGVTYTIYPPEESGYEEDDSNNSSLVVHMTNRQNSMLFCGDALEDRIEELLSTEGLTCDIIKIPHHGSKIDNLDELIDYVNPEYAVITSSDEEEEASKTLKVLEKADIAYYLTREGTITIEMGNAGINIQQE